MHALRALQKLEAEVLLSLTSIYDCEEDDLPVELDLLNLYNDYKTDREREQVLVTIEVNIFCL